MLFVPVMYTIGVINAGSNCSLGAGLTVHVLPLVLSWVLLIRYVPAKGNISLVKFL